MKAEFLDRNTLVKNMSIQMQYRKLESLNKGWKIKLYKQIKI